MREESTASSHTIDALVPAERLPPPCAIEVRQAIPSHSGLGSGTQLAMAVAQAWPCLRGTDRSTP